MRYFLFFIYNDYILKIDLSNQIYFVKEGIVLKEIGEKLKEARESIGVSLEEAAEDLKLRPSQIENIESGNMEAFKDVFYLKYFIRDYAKYLGLNYEDIIDEFNEYLFDYTSKISLEDIKNAKKNAKNIKGEKKITSPYTIEYKRKLIVPPILIYGAIAILLMLVLYCVFEMNKKDDFNDDQVVINMIERN